MKGTSVGERKDEEVGGGAHDGSNIRKTKMRREGLVDIDGCYITSQQVL